MSLVVAAEAVKVRRLCGDPDTTELPEATVQALLTEDAFDWINERKPKVSLTSLATVSGQQEYDSKPSNAYRIIDVWWMDATWLTFSPSMRVIIGAMDIDDQLAGISVIHNPSLVSQWFKKIANYDDFFKGAGYETEEGLIRLDPVPTSSGDPVYFAYSYPRYSVITAAENNHVQAIRYYVAHRAMQYLSEKRSIIRSGTGWSGGGGDREETLEEKFLDKANGLVPESPAISFG